MRSARVNDMNRTVLGLDVNDHSTSACLIVDGKIEAAAQEERFNREKRTRKFPLQSMTWCLEKAGIKIDDVSAVAVPVNPAIYLETFNPANTERARYRGELLYSPVNLLMGALGVKAGGKSRLSIETESGIDLNIHYVNHHDSHAAYAFFASPFTSASVLTADGFGEKESAALYAADRDAGLKRIRSVDFPHSLGAFYAAITEFLGMRPDRDEWKLMGASALGNPEVYYPALSKLISLNEDGTYSLDLKYFNHYIFHRPGMFTNEMEKILGAPYSRGAKTDGRFFDIAAAAQKTLEEALFEILNELSKETGSENLCFGGGVAMNCALNGKIHERTPFANVYIPPVPDDSGACVGAAYAVSRSLWPDVEIRRYDHCSFGPAYGDDEIEKLLQASIPGKYEKCDPATTAAKLIAEGKVVCFFQSAMEFGDRALGSRSILAHPGIPNMKDRINATVKNRDPYRPFAPSVLAEYQDKWFECGDAAFYMEKAYRVRPEKRAAIPAVVHADGTARLQTVTKTSNPLLYKTICEFMKTTGIPLVLNTSFNFSEEPIVMTPRDALRTFYSCGADALVIGSFLITK